MPRFAANLSMMYQEFAFLDRFAAAAADGFKAVEFLFPYAFPKEEVAKRLRDAGLENVLFNLPPGDWEAGERGMAAIPGREREFAASIDKALDYAEALGCPRLHVMAGIPHASLDRDTCRATYVANLRLAAAMAAKAGRDVLIEPINTRDIPGYFLNRQDDAQAIRAEIGAPNLKIQFDLYHCQIVEGDLAMKLKRDIAYVGHMQIAGVPERHEPDLGEVNYPYLFEVIDRLGYAGWIGCEYRPRNGTRAGLGWFAPYRP
jgi:hydroxypyruvate isomerase